MSTRTALAFSALLALVAARAYGGDRGLKVQEVLGDDAPIPTYHAFVVGINEYKFWQHLRQAKDDAEDVGKLLKTNYGFKDVKTLFDGQATLDNILKELRNYARSLGPNDALLIYYAGHGYYDKLLKKGYWVPTEARETINEEPAMSEWLPNTTLREYIEVMKVRHILVISDSCFSGSMMRGGRVELTAKENTWYKRAISQPSRWCVASGDLETVPDQSVFARKFLQTLQYPRQVVFSASDLASWIKNDVAEYGGTQPVFGPMKTASGNEVGEFVFLQEGGRPPAGATATDASGPRMVPTTPAPQPVARAAVGTLMVDAPVDGFVSLNGGSRYPISKTKALKWPDLQAGKYTVSVTSGIKSWQDTVEIRDGETTAVKATGLEPDLPPPPPRRTVIPPKPQVTAIDIFTYPNNATVYVDGQRTSAKTVQVTPGDRHTVKVEADGYEPFFTETAVSAGSTQPVSARLKELKKKSGTGTTVAPMW